MNVFESQSEPARRYLDELGRAMAGAPDALRAEVVEGVAEELRGLDDAAAESRIATLGDPRGIAADANAEIEADTTPEGPPPAGYALATAIVLVAGWYVVPFVGWIVGLVMIALGSHWTAEVRRRGILSSIAVIVASALVVFLLRGTAVWPIGLGVFIAGPLVGNIFVGSYLRRHWA